MVHPRRTTVADTPRKIRRREPEVLDTAARIFHERGYADATIQDVADALGILKGSLYYYIDSKEDLLFRLLEQVHDEVDELLEQIASREDPAIERLALYARQLMDYNLRNLIKITVYYHDVDQLSDTRRKLIYARRRVHEEFITELIREAQEDGTADASQPARLLANCVFGVLIWVYRWYRPRGPFRPEAVVDAAVLFVLGGLRGGALAWPALVDGSAPPAG
jgi:AcrR family transcriptional regulator